MFVCKMCKSELIVPLAFPIILSRISENFYPLSLIYYIFMSSPISPILFYKFVLCQYTYVIMMSMTHIVTRVVDKQAHLA